MRMQNYRNGGYIRFACVYIYRNISHVTSEFFFYREYKETIYSLLQLARHRRDRWEKRVSYINYLIIIVCVCVCICMLCVTTSNINMNRTHGEYADRTLFLFLSSFLSHSFSFSHSQRIKRIETNSRQRTMHDMTRFTVRYLSLDSCV